MPKINTLYYARECELCVVFRGFNHEDAMTFKPFPHYSPFVREIHRSLVESPHKLPVMLSFDVSFDVSLRKLLNKQLRGSRIKMSWQSFDVAVMGMTNFLYLSISRHIRYHVILDHVITGPHFERDFSVWPDYIKHSNWACGLLNVWRRI